MKNSIPKKLVFYLYNNFVGNLLGFIIGMASTRLVSHFFATRSIRNLWGLASKKTVIDRTTFNSLEWIISVLIGFIVFEIISKGLKSKMEVFLPKVKKYIVTLATNAKKIKVYEGRVQ